MARSYNRGPMLDLDAFWVYPCEIDRVIDGDTVTLKHLDQGMGAIMIERRIRLARIDTAELVGTTGTALEQARQARDVVVQWVAGVQAAYANEPKPQPRRVRSPFAVRYDKISYDRYVGEVWSRITGDNLTDLLLADGLGQPYTVARMQTMIANDVWRFEPLVLD